MLACERWTLTHSSGWAAVLVGLALLLELELGMGLGLEAMNASSEAETVAEGEVWDDDGADGEDEPVWDGDPVGELDEPVGELDVDADAAGELEPEAEPEPEPEPDGDGGTGVLLGVLVGSVPEDAGDDAGAVGETELEELEEGEGDGDGDFDGLGVGVGVGVDVAAAGSTSHLVSVLAPALVEVLGLAEAASAVIVLACAAPGQPASTPKVRDAPATVLSTAARACARRMKTALSPLLVEVTACSSWGS